MVGEGWGEHAGDSTARTWSQRLGLPGGKRAVKRLDPQAQNRPYDNEKVWQHRPRISWGIRVTPPFFSAGETEAQKGSDSTRATQ